MGDVRRRAAKTPGAADKPTRTAILNAAEAIMREEGYAAVSSRRIAATAGLKSQLVHYYFKTMDELFGALLARVEEQYFGRLAAAAVASAPLHAVWAMLIDQNGPRLTKEFIAMVTHRPVLRREIAGSAERTRSLITALIARALNEHAPDHSPPASVLAVMMESIGRLIVSDAGLGVSATHDETIAFVESQLARIEPVAPKAPGRRAAGAKPS